MVTRPMLLAAAVLLTASGCNQAGQPGAAGADNDMAARNPADAPAMAGDASGAGNPGAAAGQDMPMAAPTTALAFITEAAASDMFEIETGRLAQERATRAEVKQFARMMVEDHGRSSAELKKLAGGLTPAVTPPTGLPAPLQTRLDALRAADGAAFDRLYLEQQAAAHDNALALHRAYAERGDNDALRSFADRTAGVVERHREQVRTLSAG